MWVASLYQHRPLAFYHINYIYNIFHKKIHDNLLDSLYIHVFFEQILFPNSAFTISVSPVVTSPAAKTPSIDVLYQVSITMEFFLPVFIFALF
jgi:hypothetical protein